jgi:hypothetical protein
MKIQSALTATALAGILILGTDYLSFAATGGSFLLGKSNSAGQTTSLKNTGSGPVLKLSTTHPGTRPPLGVNSKVKVAKLNADLLDGLDSSKLAKKQHPVKVWIAPPVAGRTVSVGSTPTTVQHLNVTVPAECGTATRHTYLLQHESWWFGSNSVIEMSLTLDSTSQQFGEGTSAVTANSYVNSATTRVLVLAPGAHILRLVADSSSSSTAADPSLRATDLGYKCSGGPTSRVTKSASSRKTAGLDATR